MRERVSRETLHWNQNMYYPEHVRSGVGKLFLPRATLKIFFATEGCMLVLHVFHL